MAALKYAPSSALTSSSSAKRKGLQMFAYIKRTWVIGREFDFPITFIICEIIRGLFTHVNVITEI